MRNGAVVSKTLIVCSAVPEAVAYQRDARKRGEEIIATSSQENDESAAYYDAWEWLPNIHSADFAAALSDIARRHDVAHIFCPHNLFYNYLQQMQERGELAIPLIGKNPTIERIEQMEAQMVRAEEAAEWMRAVSGNVAISPSRLAAIIQHTESIFGESCYAKILSMIAIAPLLPKGDFVEIGSWWGKTGVLLAMLARDFELGSVLCVDPWNAGVASQKDSPDIVKNASFDIDWDAVFRGFCIHTATTASPGKFNYVRAASVQAEITYRANRTLSSPEFGDAHFTGKISLLHIDGNHDYQCVFDDYHVWRPHMAPGGWIILDDYIWQHGDGPKRLGDEILVQEKDKILRSFVSGRALFLQFQ
jgi:hypothetical protein